MEQQAKKSKWSKKVAMMVFSIVLAMALAACGDTVVENNNPDVVVPDINVDTEAPANGGGMMNDELPAE